MTAKPTVQTPYTLARDHLRAFHLYSRKHANPFTLLRDLDLLEFAIHRMRAQLVADLRDEGATWLEVAQALRLTESQARHRFGGVDSPSTSSHT